MVIPVPIFDHAIIRLVLPARMDELDEAEVVIHRFLWLLLQAPELPSERVINTCSFSSNQRGFPRSEAGCLCQRRFRKRVQVSGHGKIISIALPLSTMTKFPTGWKVVDISSVSVPVPSELT